MQDQTNIATVASASPAAPAWAPTPGSWKKALRDAVRDPDELLTRLDLPERLREAAHRAARVFPLVVPESFLSRVEPRHPEDPLLLQVLPLDLEEREVEGFSPDPVADLAAQHAPGLLRKYRGRVLLLAGTRCAVHCRYCFRRQFPYGEVPTSLKFWEPALREISGDSSIREVVLSGGDPLLVPDSALRKLVARLEAIPHLRRLRVHTRLPIVIPERIDAGLLGWLRASRLRSLIVVHANHPREIVAPCSDALRHLVREGVPVLNQSVLLRRVNDDARVLAELSERLIDVGVLPYYLHQLDPVAGAAHFHVNEDQGREIIAELRRLLPGYAVPRYVREIPGSRHKVELA